MNAANKNVIAIWDNQNTKNVKKVDFITSRLWDEKELIRGHINNLILTFGIDQVEAVFKKIRGTK